jgi:sulfate-transporting ATPase
MNVVQLAAGSLVYTAVLVLLGESIVIVHRGSGVTNFAAASVGVVGTYVFYDLWPGHGMPWPIALLIGLAASAAIGAGFHLTVMRRLRRSSVATRVIATLGLMLLVESMSDQYFAPGGAIRSVPSFLPGGQLHPFATLSFNMDGPILIGIAGAVTILLLVLERATRFGLATTAVCENETVAAGMGWSPNFIAASNWALGSALAALALILLAPVSGLSPDFLTLLVVPALGAALVGEFDSILLTLVGALAIGIGEAEVGLVTTAPGWAEAAPLIVIVGILMIRKPARYNRSDAAQRLARVGTGVMRGAALAAAAAGILLMFVVSVDWISPVTTTVIFAITMLSIVVLTGYAGQLSLAQFGLAGMSAFWMAIFSARWGWPLWASMLVAIGLTVPVGLVVAIPAFRTTGAALAIATLSLLVVIQDLVLGNPTTAGWMKSGALPPLEIFGYRFDIIGHPRHFAVFVMVVLILVCMAVANLRRSAMGRRLLAIRTNPQAAAALGVNPAAMKLYGFVVAAVITAICGILLEAELSFAEFGTFSAFASISAVLQTTIGGIGLVAGGVFAGTWVPGGLGNKILAIILPASNIPGNWLIVLTGAGVLYIIVAAPDGLMWLLKTRIDRRRAWLRRQLRRPVRAPREDPFARAIRNMSSTRQAGPRRHPTRIEVDDLVVTFGGLRAVDGVSLSVDPGEIVGLIGPNGAGKTAFIDAVSGAQRTTSGQVRLDGKVIDGLAAAGRARLGLARSFQSLELFEDMTVGENLLAASESPGRLQAVTDLIWPRAPRTTAAAVQAARDFGLEEILGLTPRQLDHGRRRLVAIARAFAANAGVIFLDEPAAGLDAGERGELGETLRRVAAEWNVGVLLVEHDVDLVFRVCDRVVAIVFGRVVAEGSPEVVRRSSALVAAYLGSPAAEAGLLPDLGGPDR